MSDRFLTVKQPWASLIMAGGKDVENRSWVPPSTLHRCGRCDGCDIGMAEGIHARRLGATLHTCGQVPPDGPFPFTLWIHAGKAVDREALRALPAQHGGIAFRYGVLLGHVTVTGCHNALTCSVPLGPRCSPWAEMAYGPGTLFHWTLADPVALPEPIPLKGMLGLPFLPDDVRVAALTQLEGATA